LSKTVRTKIVLALALLAIVSSTGFAANSPADQSNPPVWAVQGEVLVTNRLDIDFSKYLVTFIELGADRCIPCRKMQPIMKAIAQTYPDQVQVIFYDVWKDPAPAEKYGIQLIPTQVFIDQKGKEVFRHVGLFPKEEILELLKKQGII
jgi:thioredoxin 1